ncbi:hypothetical protein ABZW30_12770 [Kitasatospora sp. NPDC004669]|uniref:hypothetical protein n=1 Tax=Kitasatospora sp. NPDC004669 TaxID=3154555 RepID=UPI0033BE7DF4
MRLGSVWSAGAVRWRVWLDVQWRPQDRAPSRSPGGVAAETRAERYDPDHDTALQHALRRERHRQAVADRAAEAAHQAHQTTDAAHRRLAGTATQPLYTALDRAGLHALTDHDHQAVRDLTQGLDPATLRQVMS